MNRARAILLIPAIIVFFISGILFLSCTEGPHDGIIVFTEVFEKLQDRSPVSIDSALLIIRTRIVSLDQSKAGQPPVILSNGFYSARSPEISPDGKTMLFTARKNQGDRWQIWEINLKNLKSKSVTSLPDNCIDPAYLPNGRIVFSKLTMNSELNTANAIYSCSPDGSDIRQVTFNPHAYRALSVLQDGRILSVCRQLLPDRGEEAYMVLRPDGTKNEFFYKGGEGSRLFGRASETNNGSIVFIESDSQNPFAGNVISVNYNQPFHSYNNITYGIGGDFKSVYPLKSGKYLVSYRKSISDRYGLFEFDPQSKSFGKIIYTSQDFDITDAVAIENHGRPKKLPSEVDMGVKTGLILCQDINFNGIRASGVASSLPKVSRIRIIGRDSTLGEVDVEKDGSFYLKVIADTPFRIEAIDDKGRTFCESCDWIYLRPNERRGCVGCHEGQEIVPENKVSLAVKHAPVNIPVHINKVAEKKVSLE